ncbi:Uncharacterized protein FWK35_00014479, partial [Aphis craccivora]
MITSLAFLPVEEIPNEINGAPRFPLEIWNVRHQTIKNSHRTNNFSEGWNSSFNKLVGSANPSFWSVLRSLQLDECSSHLNKNTRKKNQNTQNKIHDACVQHERTSGTPKIILDNVDPTNIVPIKIRDRTSVVPIQIRDPTSTLPVISLFSIQDPTRMRRKKVVYVLMT